MKTDPDEMIMTLLYMACIYTLDRSQKRVIDRLRKGGISDQEAASIADDMEHARIAANGVHGIPDDLRDNVINKIRTALGI